MLQPQARARKRPSALRLLLLVAGSLVLSLVALAGYFYWYVVRPEMTIAGPALPASLEKPRVILDVQSLRKSSFAALPGVGQVTDMKQLPAGLVIAGMDGAVVTDEDGRAKGERLPIPGRVEPIEIVPAGEQFVFFTPGWLMEGPRLFDRNGVTLWASSKPVDSAEVVDWDGKGDYNFVLAANDIGGIELRDRAGRRYWHDDLGNPWCVKVARDSSDGKRWILNSNAGGVLEVRDRAGKARRLQFDAYVGKFALVPDAAPVRSGVKRYQVVGPPEVMIAGKSAFELVDLRGRLVARLPAPEVTAGTDDLEPESVAYAAFTQPGKFYTAVLARLSRYSGRSALYVYDPDGALVYQELLKQEGGALLTQERKDRPGTERLLLGGVDGVSAYER